MQQQEGNVNRLSGVVIYTCVGGWQLRAEQRRHCCVFAGADAGPAELNKQNLWRTQHKHRTMLKEVWLLPAAPVRPLEPAAHLLGTCSASVEHKLTLETLVLLDWLFLIIELLLVFQQNRMHMKTTLIFFDVVYVLCLSQLLFHVFLSWNQMNLVITIDS